MESRSSGSWAWLSQEAKRDPRKDLERPETGGRADPDRCPICPKKRQTRKPIQDRHAPDGQER